MKFFLNIFVKDKYYFIEKPVLYNFNSQYYAICQDFKVINAFKTNCYLKPIFKEVICTFI